jgi:hypothetical protein
VTVFVTVKPNLAIYFLPCIPQRGCDVPFSGHQVGLSVQEAFCFWLAMEEALHGIQAGCDTLHGALGQLPLRFDGVKS